MWQHSKTTRRDLVYKLRKSVDNVFWAICGQDHWIIIQSLKIKTEKLERQIYLFIWIKRFLSRAFDACSWLLQYFIFFIYPKKTIVFLTPPYSKRKTWKIGDKISTNFIRSKHFRMIKKQKKKLYIYERQKQKCMLRKMEKVKITGILGKIIVIVFHVVFLKFLIINLCKFL